MYSIINLLCGIGMFLIGMSLMSDSTTAAFGEKLKDILSRLTKNKISGVLTGFAVTGVIQSSCATTVTAVSFVDAGLLALTGAVGIVMGANIGTTVTSLIIAFNFSDVAPLAIFIGAFMKLLCKNEKLQSVGIILSGFGILFVGLNTMASSFESLKDSSAFLSFVTASQGKLRGVITGFIMTAVMQSSSATVGILQALAMQGLIPTESAFYIILGQNIGAVIPVIISSVGTAKTAKQVGVIHLLFNLIGTVIFIVLMEFVPIGRLLSFADSDSMKISLFHIIFNVLSTVILLPFSDGLINISNKLLNFNIISKSTKPKHCF
ncbi:MAG: Na/Pi cotransporter family protein [Clostridia bacterium]|nr:Na/Pi cotransporter family protein [Clostridia bacterium]